MSQVQVAVSAPGNRYKVWRLPADQLIGLLIPTVVERMGLPTQLQWNLVSQANGKVLPAEGTLAAERIPQNAPVALEPVRNTLFKEFLQALYDEAEGNVQDELWDQALEKLQELHEYDPRFPDPKGLAHLAQVGLAPSAVPAGGISWGLVIGGLAIAGTLAVGTIVAAGGAGYLIYRAMQEEVAPDPYDYDNGGNSGQPHTGDVPVSYTHLTLPTN